MTLGDPTSNRIKSVLERIVEVHGVDEAALARLADLMGTTSRSLQEWTREGARRTASVGKALAMGKRLRPLDPGLGLELSEAANQPGISVSWSDEDPATALRAEIERLGAELAEVRCDFAEDEERLQRHHREWVEAIARRAARRNAP